MKEVNYGETVTPPSGYEERTWYRQGDSNKTDIDFEHYPIIADTTFVLHKTYTVNWIDETETEDIYVLRKLCSDILTVSETEQQNFSFRVFSTKNGVAYSNLTFNVEQNVNWIQLNEIENVGDCNFLFKITISELPQELYENGRLATITIGQVDGETTTLSIEQIYEGEIDVYYDPIIENQTGTTSLKLLQYGIDTKGYFRLAADFDKTASTSKIWAFSCAGSVYAEFQKNNTGGISVSGNNTMDDYSMVDDYGIIFKRTSGYGAWQGGNSSSASYNRAFSISTAKDTSIVRQVTIQGYADENNNILFRGEIVNKAIRVPSSGISGQIENWQYPYTFDSIYYYTNPKMTYITKTGSAELTATVGENDTINVNGFNATLMNVNDNSLDYMFEYNIYGNNTGDYKYHMVVIDSKGLSPSTSGLYGTNTSNLNIVMIHFIQEYKVKNRIYYGKGFTDKTFDDNYNENTSNDYKYHSWFETCSSKILLENIVTINESSDYVAYPNSSYFEYNFGLTNNGTPEVLSSNYMWGDESYTIVTIPSGNKAIFTKK